MGFTVKQTRRDDAPVRLVVYGRGGIGKSTLAASAPSPIFIASEEGLEQLDADAIEPYPKTFEEVLAALDHVSTLDHKTVAIDSIDWLEPIIWDYVCRQNKKKSIEDFGFGKGYIAALDQWRLFLHKLSALRAKGMHVVLIAHAVRKPFKNPLGDDYDHWTIKLHEKASGLIVEWSDVVGFADDDIATDDTSGRVKALTTGRRIIRTHPNPAYLAKTRYAMPAKLPLSWDAFMIAVRGGDLASVTSLKELVEERIKTLGDQDVEKKVRGFLKEKGETVPNLTEAVRRLEVNINESRKAS